MSFFALLIAILTTTQPLEILYRNRTYYPIASYSVEHCTWIRLSDFASVLKFDVEYDASIYKMVLHSPSHKISLHGDNPFVTVDGKLINLPQEVKLRDRKLFVSVSQLQRIFGETLGIDFVLEAGGRGLRLFDQEVEIEKLQLEGSKDTTRLLVYTSAPLQFSTETNTPGLVVLTLFRSRIKDSFSPPRPKGLIETVNIVPRDDEVRIEVSALSETRAFLTRKLGNPPGISLILVGPRRPSKREENYGKINHIVVDPGHGGKDPGAVGPSGLLEKDVNLQISRILKELLEDRLGVDIIMTREDDSFVPLSERARVANESPANLFISIHCNAAPRRRKNTGGVETYFLSVAKTDEARAVEARENASIKFEVDEHGAYNSDDISLILWDLAQNEFLEESAILAENVQKGIAEFVPIENRGINQAGFFVLNGVYMPSILIECAFISNKEEERLLKDESFQRKLAEGILKGIMAFKRKYEARSRSSI